MIPVGRLVATTLLLFAIGIVLVVISSTGGSPQFGALGVGLIISSLVYALVFGASYRSLNDKR